MCVLVLFCEQWPYKRRFWSCVRVATILNAPRPPGLICMLCAVCCAAVEGARYVARFPTRIKWSTIRLPFSLFRPEAEGQPPLVPEQIKHISLRYELRRPTSATALGPAAGAAAAAAGPGAAAGGWQQQQQQQQPGGMVRRPGAPGTATSAAALMEEQMKRLSKFKLEVDWIKALPGGSGQWGC